MARPVIARPVGNRAAAAEVWRSDREAGRVTAELAQAAFGWRVPDPRGAGWSWTCRMASPVRRLKQPSEIPVRDPFPSFLRHLDPLSGQFHPDDVGREVVRRAAQEP